MNSHHLQNYLFFFSILSVTFLLSSSGYLGSRVSPTQKAVPTQLRADGDVYLLNITRHCVSMDAGPKGSHICTRTIKNQDFATYESSQSSSPDCMWRLIFEDDADLENCFDYIILQTI